MASSITVPDSTVASPTGGILFSSLPLRNRAAVLAAAAASIALLVAGWTWSQIPDYKILFTGIPDRDGGAVVAALAQLNVPYKVGENGGAIMVPANQVHETRLKLASQGLPKGGTQGFELMEAPKFGITQFQEQVNYQRAIEGELAKSIQSLGAVRNARVHIAIPKQTMFLKDQQKPSASVLVSLYPGKTLDRTQVAGITHLISSSLPDLPPRSVSVIDESGALLSQPSGAGSAGQLDAVQLSYVSRLEESYIKRILDILVPLYGADNVRAQVKADADFSETESTSEAFKPNQTAAESTIRSMQISEAPGGMGGASGVPGALSNQPPGSASAPIQGGAATNPGGAGGAAAQAAGLKRDAITNYEVDKTVRHTRIGMGNVKRISAAVVVNHRKSSAGGKSVTTPLTADEITQINALVKEAIGFQKERGDSINVVNAPFTLAAPELLPDLPFWKHPENIAMAKDIAKPALIALLGLYLLLAIVRPAIKRLSTLIAAPELGADGGAEAQLTGPDRAVALPGVLPRALALENARQMAKQDPKIVANVVKNWASGNE